MVERTSTMPENKMQLQLNNNLSTIFVDGLKISSRKDGIHLIQFSTIFPDGIKEQLRVVVPDHSLKEMLDVLCKQTGHYPTKTSKTN